MKEIVISWILDKNHLQRPGEESEALEPAYPSLLDVVSMHQDICNIELVIL